MAVEREEKGCQERQRKRDQREREREVRRAAPERVIESRARSLLYRPPYAYTPGPTAPSFPTPYLLFLSVGSVSRSEQTRHLPTPSSASTLSSLLRRDESAILFARHTPPSPMNAPSTSTTRTTTTTTATVGKQRVEVEQASASRKLMKTSCRPFARFHSPLPKRFFFSRIGFARRNCILQGKRARSLPAYSPLGS